MEEISLSSVKTRDWPNDWDLHLLNTFDLYFDDDNSYSIYFLRGYSSFSYLYSQYIVGDPSLQEMRQYMPVRSIKAQSIFYRGEKFYNACFVYHGESQVLCILMKIDGVLESKDGECFLNVSSPIEAFSATSAYECAEKIEEAIVKDNDNDDDDDFEGAPTPDPVTGIYSCPST